MVDENTPQNTDDDPIDPETGEDSTYSESEEEAVLADDETYEQAEDDQPEDDPDSAPKQVENFPPPPPPEEPRTIKLNEERVQDFANILSMLAIIGRMDKTAVQRVLVSLGSTIVDVPEAQPVDTTIAARLITAIATEKGEEAALAIMNDMSFIARRWRTVLNEYIPMDPYRLMPFAEIIFQLVNYSGDMLQEYNSFERFGGQDLVLPMEQLSSALRPYPVPQPGLNWELVGFTDPADQALVGSGENIMYLFKAASSGIDLRFSELERNTGDGARREYDIRIDAPLFAAFVAGLLGDMLYWLARMRANAMPGQEMWHRVQTLLTPRSDEPRAENY